MLLPVPHTHRALPGAKRSLAAVTLSLAFFAVLAGCENKSGTNLTQQQSEQGLGLPDTSSDGKRIKLDPRCDLNETVVDPKEGTVEYVLSQLLEAAAASGDEKVNFQKFYSHFPADTEEKWVRDQYFSRARKFVNKYLQQDAGSGIVFKICERREQGNGEVKVFIQSLDPNKSNPPVTLKKDEAGVWKVIFYTP